MNYLVSASTDVGIQKPTNQDSLSVKTFQTPQGRMVFAVLCDGMGGLSKGELASATVVKAFEEWLVQCAPTLVQGDMEDAHIRSSWEKVIAEQNEKIMNYGKRTGVELGTTVTVLLVTETRYYILNVGDSRVYEISDCLQQLTQDHTVVAREVKQGRLTPEEAEKDPRRNVLLQCVGASENVCPDLFFGDTRPNVVYMLCSDGFRHKITADEIYQTFYPDRMLDSRMMKQNEEYLIGLNKQRLESDNISVITIRTF